MLFPMHWLIVLVLASTLIPVARILSRTGHNAGWCVFCLFPLINLILLWVFAFKAWPTDKALAATGSAGNPS